MTAGRMHRWGALVLGGVLALVSAAAFAQRTPDAVVKEVVDAAVAALKSERARLSGPIPIEAALAITRKSIVPHVDFDRITRDATGRAWTAASAAQRSALTREFSALLTHVVARLIATYEDEEFVVESANPAKEPVVVRINVRHVRSPGESPMQPMFVSLHRAGQTWRIHELRAENVQIVRLYSANFAVVMERDGGMDGLIKALAERNARNAAAPQSAPTASPSSGPTAAPTQRAPALPSAPWEGSSTSP